MQRLSGWILVSSAVIVLLAGCTRWQPIAVSSDYDWQGDAYRVRVTEMNGDSWILSDFHVAADTLRGSGYEEALYRDRIRRTARSVEVPLQDVASIEERTRRTKQEVLLGGGIVAAGALTLIILLP